MAASQDCCTPCASTVPPVNIPGSAGATGPAGADGTDGINAFTFVADPGFVVPALGANVTVPTVDATWMAVGQNVYITGAGYFQVVSVGVNGTSASLEYLDGYAGNTNSGATISAGAQISPGGTQPTLLPLQTFYAVSGSQALTETNTMLLSATVTLPTTGSYILSSNVRLDFSAATTAASLTAFLKLRRTNNTPADIANAVREAATGIVTDAENTFTIAMLPDVLYAATAGDTLQLQGSLSGLPYAGDIIAVEASIVAQPIA